MTEAEKALDNAIQREYLRQIRVPIVDELTARVGPAMVALMSNLDRPRYEAIMAACCSAKVSQN